MTIHHGRITQLLLQPETVFRTAPNPAAAFRMKFSPGLEYGRDPQRQADPTLNNTVLEVKSDEGDAVISGTIPAILCLNDIGQWLKLLLGDPVTTGAGPYTHTFTLSLDDPPSALIELGYLTTGGNRFARWLGNVVNSISWNVLEAEQNMQVELLGAVEVDPAPGAVFDAAPTAYAKNRACAKGGEIYDVQGASTLGKVISADVKITRDLEGQRLGDGLEGYGEFLVGQPSITGAIKVLFDSGTTIFDHARINTSKALKLVSKNAAGTASLTLNVPQVEFAEAKHKIQTSKGLIAETTYRGHSDATAPTVVLVNAVATY